MSPGSISAPRRALFAAIAALAIGQVYGADRALAGAGRPGEQVGRAIGGRASSSYRPGIRRLRRPMRRPAQRTLGPAAALTIVARDSQTVGYLDAAHYKAVKDVSLQLLRKHPPDRSFFVAVGRSPVAIASFLSELNPHMVMTFPSSDMRKAIEPEWKQDYFDHFEALIPEDVLKGDRTIVLIDRSRAKSGNSLAVLRNYLQEYLTAIGSSVKVEAVGLAPAGPLAEGVELMSTARQPRLFLYKQGKQGGFDHDEDVAPLAGKHRIGVNRLEELAENPNHAPFRDAMRDRMAQDADLDKVLRAEFGELLTDSEEGE